MDQASSVGQEPASPVRQGVAVGRRVLLLGGDQDGPSRLLAWRLASAGHRLAVQRTAAASAPQAPARSEPIVLIGDRAGPDDVTDLVTAARRALGGLDAVVILPGPNPTRVALDSDAADWADSWSRALASEVLAAACAAHAAARSFLADGRPGRIILVARQRDRGVPGDLLRGVVQAALTALGTELAEQLGPHGVGVTVMTTAPVTADGTDPAPVAELIEAVLSPVVPLAATIRVG